MFPSRVEASSAQSGVTGPCANRNLLSASCGTWLEFPASVDSVSPAFQSKRMPISPSPLIVMIHAKSPSNCLFAAMTWCPSVVLHVLAVIFAQFKIFYTVVASVAVFVMHNFRPFEKAP